jgi:RNA polymerase sigma factor (sigma-70 family)
MTAGTEMGGSKAAFPSTMWTQVLAARDRDAAGFRERLDSIIRLYWKPVYWTLRTRWGRASEDAKDLAQAFFASFLEKDRLANVGPEKGRFRTFLRVVLDNFMRNELEAMNAVKRGGRAEIVSISAGDQEIPIAADQLRPEEVFDRAWAAHVFRATVDELREHYRAAGREITFTAFDRHALGRHPPSYPDLAKELGIHVHELENHLKHAKNTFAKLLRARVRETISDEASLEDELRALGELLR